MKTKKAAWIFLLAIVVLASPATSLGADPDAIIGVWSTSDNDAKIEIYQCGAEYCGRIFYLEEPNYPPDDEGGMAGLPKVDRYNPNPELRKRSLITLTFLEGFRYVGNNSWGSGRIYNPEDGKSYKARISLADGNHVMLRGYWGISLLGRTETWVRSAGASNPGA